MVLDWNSPPTRSDDLKLPAARTILDIRTAVFKDSLDWVLAKLQSVAGRKAVVFFGKFRLLPQEYEVVPGSTFFTLDGSGYYTEYVRLVLPERDERFQRLLQQIEGYGVPIHVVTRRHDDLTPLIRQTVGKIATDYERSEEGRLERLRQIAEASRGNLRVADKAEVVDQLSAAFNREPNSFYSLTFFPSDVTSRGFRKLEIKVRNGERVLQSKHGYYYPQARTSAP